MNQSKLMSMCGLNNVKHKEILDEMVQKQLLNRTEESWGSKIIFKYDISDKGREIFRAVLQPYEDLFPRENKDDR
ncbi:MAG: hypothetical protein KC483_03000 [Nitrosarchaeum sp.]|nr:hypothetical protein [Nitrosarchaeum sp.]MCA9820672.1 hypothetical protein [Nitrosarchaeum sp.]